MRRRVLSTALLILVGLPGRAEAAPALVGTDVPSCVSADPGAPFVVLPVNAGKAFTVNSCLAEQAAGTRQVQLFVNGGMPGPTGAHWPGGACAGTLSLTCAQRYGTAIAADALQAVADSGAQVLPRIWWLDIETLNTWAGPPSANLASVSGTVHALRSRPDLVSAVGIYSSRQQWGDITAFDQTLSVPQWLATPMSSLSTAQHNCSSRASFTRGPVVMVQLQRTDGADGDLVCPPRMASHATPRSGTTEQLTGAALPGSRVTVSTHEPDRTIRSTTVVATPAGTWSLLVRLRYTAGVQVSSSAGANRGTVPVLPTLPLSVTPGRCALVAAGTVSPRWAGQEVQVVVSGGRSSTVRTGGGGAWRVVLGQPCGSRLSVQARTTGLGGRTRWVSAARSRSVIVRTTG